jgi:hypothetical protein
MESLPVINKAYSIFREFVIINSHLEKRWRYSIGINIENSILECIKLLILAKKAPKQFKMVHLLNASAVLEVVSLELRFLLEEELVNKTKIFQIQSSIAETGRMMGGWIKSLT